MRYGGIHAWFLVALTIGKRSVERLTKPKPLTTISTAP